MGGKSFYTPPMTTKNQHKSIASAMVEIASATDLIPIFPAGITLGADGRGPYVLQDAESVIANSLSRSVDLVIDRDHAIDLLPPGSPIKAAGWIKKLVAKDGAIWAEADWTPQAQKELADREYRYISPVFNFNPQTREVTRILRATLTNNPNFDMKAIASQARFQEDTTTTEKENVEMKTQLMIALASALGLSAETAEDTILEAATKKITEAAATEKAVASIKTALKADDKAGLDDVVALASKTQTVDLAKYVPMEAHQEIASKLSSLQSDVAKEKACAAVEAAMKAGKVTPATKEWAIGYASQDLASFNKFVETAPVILEQGAEKASQTPMMNAQGSDDDEKAICSMLGLSIEDYRKQQEAESKAA